jgi:hypothetical protein
MGVPRIIMRLLPCPYMIRWLWFTEKLFCVPQFDETFAVLMRMKYVHRNNRLSQNQSDAAPVEQVNLRCCAVNRGKFGEWIV